MANSSDLECGLMCAVQELFRPPLDVSLASGPRAPRVLPPTSRAFDVSTRSLPPNPRTSPVSTRGLPTTFLLLPKLDLTAPIDSF